jgi:formate hydrogenlyase subunit 4
LNEIWIPFAPQYLLVAVSFFILLLSENCRIPFDDPNTHLELTMIHEVMALDYGGWDLGLITYASAIKHWLFCSIVAGFLLPLKGISPFIAMCAGIAGIFVIALMVGVIESARARIRISRAPVILLGACILSFIALMITVTGGFR